MSAITPPEISNVQGVTIVKPGPDFSNLYESLLQHLSIVTALAESITPPRLLLDLEHVRFVGSAFLGQLVTNHKILSGRKDGQFALCNVNSFCRAALSTTKLESVLQIFESRDDAVAALVTEPAG